MPWSHVDRFFAFEIEEEDMKAEIEPLLDRIGSSYYAPHTSVQRYESGMSSPALDQVPSKGSPGPLRGNGGGSSVNASPMMGAEMLRFQTAHYSQVRILE